MSDVITQKCNVCGSMNVNNDPTWIRIFGATLGNSPQPIIAWQRAAPGQPRAPGTPPQRLMLDFCPDCAAKTMVDKVPGMYLAKSPQSIAVSPQPKPTAT